MIQINNNDSKSNIWQDILNEAMNQKELEEYNLFVFGNKHCGKKAVIKNINKELLYNYDNEGKKDCS